jgi:hypothetical protein
VLSYELSAGDSGAAELLRLGESWEGTVPAAALDAYESGMRIAWSADPPLAEEALVRWVRLLGRTSGLSEASLARLPAGWSSPAMEGLREWLKAPEVRPAEWWRSEPARSALAAVALGLGRDRLVRSEPAKAEAVWLLGRDLADRIILALGADAVMAARPELRIEKDKVYVMQVRPGTDEEALTALLRQTGGVSQVVAPRRSPEKKKG